MDKNTSERDRVLVHPNNKKTLSTDLRVLAVDNMCISLFIIAKNKQKKTQHNLIYLNFFIHLLSSSIK